MLYQPLQFPVTIHGYVFHAGKCFLSPYRRQERRGSGASNEITASPVVLRHDWARARKVEGGVERVGGDDGEFRPWNYTYVLSCVSASVSMSVNEAYGNPRGGGGVTGMRRAQRFRRIRRRTLCPISPRASPVRARHL